MEMRGRNIAVPGYMSQLGDALYQLQKDNILCDVVLLGDDGCVRAHSSVLSAACAYFKQSLLNSSTDNSVSTIYLKGTKVVELHSLLQLLYTGQVYVSPTNMPKITILLENIQMPDVLQKIITECFFRSDSGLNSKVEVLPNQSNREDVYTSNSKLHDVKNDREHAGNNCNFSNSRNVFSESSTKNNPINFVKSDNSNANEEILESRYTDIYVTPKREDNVPHRFSTATSQFGDTQQYFISSTSKINQGNNLQRSALNESSFSESDSLMHDNKFENISSNSVRDKTLLGIKNRFVESEDVNIVIDSDNSSDEPLDSGTQLRQCGTHNVTFDKPELFIEHSKQNIPVEHRVWKRPKEQLTQSVDRSSFEISQKDEQSSSSDSMVNATNSRENICHIEHADSSGIALFDCNMCSESFRGRDLLMNHMQERHQCRNTQTFTYGDKTENIEESFRQEQENMTSNELCNEDSTVGDQFHCAPMQDSIEFDVIKEEKDDSDDDVVLLGEDWQGVGWNDDDQQEEFDIKDVCSRFLELAARWKISHRFMAIHIVGCSSPGTIDSLIKKSNMKTWAEITGKGRQPYLAMKRFLEDPNFQQEIQVKLQYEHLNKKKTGPKAQTGQKRGTQFSTLELTVLCKMFEKDPKPTFSVLEMLANGLNTSLIRIRTWFNNQRARDFDARKVLEREKRFASMQAVSHIEEVAGTILANIFNSIDNGQ